MAKRKPLPTPTPTIPHDYAIVSIQRGKRYYWNQDSGWGYWVDATYFTADERKVLSLPFGGMWISVLHGMGKGKFYAADSELNPFTGATTLNNPQT